MIWYESYIEQLTEVYRAASERIAKFPPPLNEIGLQYAEKFNPVKQDKGKDYICTLLPYWLQDQAGLTNEQCGQLSLANVYGMLYFFIQDDVMDDGPMDASGLKQQLALGNLFYLEMFAVFRSLFPSDSPFWQHYEQYVSVWADCVVNEGDANYFLNDPLRTAGKAGPVKVSCVAAWLLAGQPHNIAKSEQAVDIALMTLQMLDDWADWEEDMKEGSYNGLLAMIASDFASQAGGVNGRSSEEGSITRLTKEQVETAIYVHCCMNRYAAFAKDNYEKLLLLEGIPSPLIGFQSYMVACLTETADHIASKKSALLLGGLNYHFHSQVK
ncbi:hypothetical protein M6D81_24110 [Paenibacillus sp. J5C_2022]|uniref:hypothetical protein n=1 Tax=Paenibacillus sp. J5C2022 TaxID=2977129 RepID=UPI0021D3A2A8|nr:hypothetical protein [Paenibacillus sp. J5C2022]MCU6711789.1 hypothetical protein [Paenibacillus sp. J5C2022]